MVLTEIGRSALRAGNGRGTVIIRECAGHASRPVIMQIADLVGQPIMIMVSMPVMVVGPRQRQSRRDGQGGQD